MAIPEERRSSIFFLLARGGTAAAFGVRAEAVYVLGVNVDRRLSREMTALAEATLAAGWLLALGALVERHGVPRDARTAATSPRSWWGWASWVDAS